jgi:hypothetical protein
MHHQSRLGKGRDRDKNKRKQTMFSGMGMQEGRCKGERLFSSFLFGSAGDLTQDLEHARQATLLRANPQLPTLLYFQCYFEIHLVAQPGLEFVILLPQPPE